MSFIVDNKNSSGSVTWKQCNLRFSKYNNIYSEQQPLIMLEEESLQKQTPVCSWGHHSPGNQQCLSNLGYNNLTFTISLRPPPTTGLFRYKMLKMINASSSHYQCASSPICWGSNIRPCFSRLVSYVHVNCNGEISIWKRVQCGDCVR